MSKPEQTVHTEATTPSGKHLPPLTREQDKRLQRTLNFTGYRVVSHLFYHNGDRTDTIKRECNLENVTRCIFLVADRLESLGLSVHCKPQVPRQKGPGSWHLEIVDFSKWLGDDSANDGGEL